ncbi:hypothetical protein AO1008_06312 [Aspergillus oryzae 100-8]|uniref:Uncharacterized protein n=1 Tax=Aspergillus oryzae (strain 3.042) TaxID=1160506 RepID=I8A7L5_ASPO3|nr:hypothetical protein Ao3042_02358 [Aspergillus oryzae 3.042]KDE80076.1 hypothetical protein AO1008_06312 [Aspergillus oryzae 100-8]|eukprot:EIT81137.1 hypothetical protein Ao3042_02358 [Aspergillus oryzae 3.042]
MRSTFVFIACITAYSFAAPAFFDNAYNFSNDLSEYLGRVSKHIEHSKDILNSATCDTSSVELPAQASGLPSPSDQKLLYVALGRGTQFRRSLKKNLDRNNDEQHGLDRLLKASASAIILHQLLRKVQ